MMEINIILLARVLQYIFEEEMKMKIRTFTVFAIIFSLLLAAIPADSAQKEIGRAHV